MNWSWWYLVFLIPLLTMIAVIATASARRKPRLSVSSISMPQVAWKKLLGIGLVVVVGTWYATRVPGAAPLVIVLVSAIIATVFWRHVTKFIGVSCLVMLLLGMGSCFFVCGRGTLNLYNQYQEEMAAKEKERKERFPTAGEGIATKTEPLKCYLDPWKSTGKGSGPVKYVPVKYPNIHYDGTPHKPGSRWSIPQAGNYLVYPAGDKPVEYRWWQ